MFTPDELRALALLSALVTLGAGLTWMDARHPKLLSLTLGDSLALGASVPGSQPLDSLASAPERAASRPTPANGAPDSARGKTSFGLDGRLDLNHATADELEGLPGIGPKTAQRILEDLRKRGPFRKVSDLRRVKGIGAKTLARLLPHVTVKVTRGTAP